MTRVFPWERAATARRVFYRKNSDRRMGPATGKYAIFVVMEVRRFAGGFRCCIALVINHCGGRPNNSPQCDIKGHAAAAGTRSDYADLGGFWVRGCAAGFLPSFFPLCFADCGSARADLRAPPAGPIPPSR